MKRVFETFEPNISRDLIEFGVPEESESSGAVERQLALILDALDVRVVAEGHQRVPLESQVHLLSQRVEQQHRLTPGGVDLHPLDGDGRQATQTETVDGAEGEG